MTLTCCQRFVLKDSPSALQKSCDTLPLKFKPSMYLDPQNCFKDCQQCPSAISRHSYSLISTIQALEMMLRSLIWSYCKFAHLVTFIYKASAPYLLSALIVRLEWSEARPARPEHTYSLTFPYIHTPTHPPESL